MRSFSWGNIILLLWLQLKSVLGQDECKDVIFPEDSYCENVNSWEEFATWIDESVPGDELYFCPFDIEKGDGGIPVSILWGLSIICVRTEETDSCTLRGPGILIEIDTSEDTLFHSLDFADGDDHAVHISSLEGAGSEVTRTLCFCTFNG